MPHTALNPSLTENRQAVKGLLMNARRLMTQPPWWFVSIQKFGLATVLVLWFVKSFFEPLLQAHFQTLNAVQTGMQAQVRQGAEQTKILEKVESAIISLEQQGRQRLGVLKDIRENSAEAQAGDAELEDAG